MSIDFSDPDEDTIHSPHALAYDLDLPFRILRALSPPCLLSSVACPISSACTSSPKMAIPR